LPLWLKRKISYKAQWTGLLASTWPNHCSKSTSTHPVNPPSCPLCKSKYPLCKSWKSLHYVTCCWEKACNQKERVPSKHHTP
jgi:hypothetical protein